MPLPIVAVVGRPNVGKSTFVNRIAQADEAIVHEMRGVTRDRSYHEADWNGVDFKLIDTGGIEMGDDDAFQGSIRNQALAGANEADVILFLVDGKTGVNADDEAVARILRKTSKPVFLVVNKLDTPNRMDEVWEFYQLGLGDPWPVSAMHGHGTGDLLDEVVNELKKVDLPADADEEDGINVAIIGRPNAGKSSLTNKLTANDRSIVSDVAGTTRDAIDTRFTDNGEDFVIIDTAGIRRKRAIEYQSLERFSIVRALAAIDRSDVSLLVIDATQGVTEQDSKIAGYIDEQGKAAIIVINKWDAIEKDTGTMNEYVAKVREGLKFMQYAPVLFISALTGQRTNRVLETVRAVYEQASRRVTTGLLNDILTDAQAALQPPATSGRRLKIYYATQQATNPPTFVMFVNDQTLMHFSYERYLEKQFRKAFGFEGTPLRFILRERKKDDADGARG